ncbi:hypothetical protein FRC07_012049 [Ceratobasidium sp. 392]|nr:hypothetical protein FRC07_012049 [Ceratobasidium sp. 392]
MARTKKVARKSTGGKPPRKREQVADGISIPGQSDGNSGKVGKKVKKAEAKAAAAANDPKNAGSATKILETQISETWKSQKMDTKEPIEGVEAEPPATSAAPVAPS